MRREAAHDRARRGEAHVPDRHVALPVQLVPRVDAADHDVRAEPAVIDVLRERGAEGCDTGLAVHGHVAPAAVLEARAHAIADQGQGQAPGALQPLSVGRVEHEGRHGLDERGAAVLVQSRLDERRAGVVDPHALRRLVVLQPQRGESGEGLEGEPLRLRPMVQSVALLGGRRIAEAECEHAIAGDPPVRLHRERGQLLGREPLDRVAVERDDVRHGSILAGPRGRSGPGGCETAREGSPPRNQRRTPPQADSGGVSNDEAQAFSSSSSSSSAY